MQVEVRHPLEPLTIDELAAAVAILRGRQGLGESYRFVSVELHEPPKDQLERLPHGQAPARAAAAVLLDRATGQTYEAVVGLEREEVLEWRHIPHAHSPYMMEEFERAATDIKADPDFQAAMARRGITDLESIAVEPWPAGYYGDAADHGRRLTRAICWVRLGELDNHYAHPIENVIVTYDYITREVLLVEDHGVVPVPQQPGDYFAERIPDQRTDLKPLTIEQPDGPSFEVDSHAVRWQKWHFRVGFTPREGLVLHEVGYEDGGRVRPILHRASLAEMVVPYGDPGPTHYRKNAFDAGEFQMGVCANSLELGCDCLGEIRYFDAAMINNAGEAYTLKNAVCMHEEDFGLLWKHRDGQTKRTEVRRSRRLVVSFIATVGNYEYGFYWSFYQDGTLEFEIKLTGIMATGAVAPGERPAYGQLLNADGLYAPIHQHFFSMRLDMDVDGPINRLYEVNASGVPIGPENPHGNAIVSRATLLEDEAAAQRTIDAGSARFWKVVNPAVTNAVGEPVAYALMPSSNRLPFAAPESHLLARAGFMSKHLWATPYAPAERYAAGEYPNQSRGGAGLPEWTRANRSLVDGDLVLWYTLGSHHAARLEDWPVMPVQHVGFKLQPFGFFDSNPGLDVPPSAASNGHACH